MILYLLLLRAVNLGSSGYFILKHSSIRSASNLSQVLRIQYDSLGPTSQKLFFKISGTSLFCFALAVSHYVIQVDLKLPKMAYDLPGLD